MEDELNALVELLLEGDARGAVAEARRLLTAGSDRPRLVAESLQVAMERMDTKCTAEQFNLLEIMLTGRAVMAVARELFPEDGLPPTRGTVVIATPQGDVHDLGKNITKMVLTAKGFRVVDCGKDCPVQRVVDTAREEGAIAVLASGLITPVIPQVRRLRGLLRERGLSEVRVIAGGAALKQSSPQALNVDYVAQDAFDGARFLEALSRPSDGRAPGGAFPGADGKNGGTAPTEGP